MRIRFYGKLAEAVGREVEVEFAPAGSIGELRSRMIEIYPILAADLANGRAKACVGGEIVSDAFVVGTAEEVELLAPVSGG